MSSVDNYFLDSYHNSSSKVANKANAVGVLQILTSTTSGPHYKHAVLFAVLAVASFVAANFARPKTA